MAWWNALTAAQKEKIRKAYNNLSNGREVAQQFGKGKTTIYRAIGRQYARPRWTEAEKLTLLEKHTAGWPHKRIAAWLGRRSTTAVTVKICRIKKEMKENYDLQF